MAFGLPRRSRDAKRVLRDDLAHDLHGAEHDLHALEEVLADDDHRLAARRPAIRRRDGLDRGRLSSGIKS